MINQHTQIEIFMLNLLSTYPEISELSNSILTALDHVQKNFTLWKTKLLEFTIKCRPNHR